MITFGAGISAGLAVRLYPRVTCVELNETCRQIAHIFRGNNHDVLSASNLTLAIDDGRNYLARSDRRYSAIIADATHPHSYDSWVLFTREVLSFVPKKAGGRWRVLPMAAPARPGAGTVLERFSIRLGMFSPI